MVGTQVSTTNAATKVFHPSGVFDDIQGGKLSTEIGVHFQGTTHTVVVNLESVSFIDSAGLGALATAQKMALATGKHLILCGMGTQIKMAFEISGIIPLFEIHDSCQWVGP